MTAERYRFAPARTGEAVVYGAQRPGYPQETVYKTSIEEWIDFMKGKGIQRVCCLLPPPSQLSFYRVNLLGEYRNAFGCSNVRHIPIEDFCLCDPTDLESGVLPFLAESEAAGLPVVAHCSGGSGRTGHVLAAWLVRHRGLTVDAALSAVRDMGRNPREAIQCGKATEAQLQALLSGPKAPPI